MKRRNFLTNLAHISAAGAAGTFKPALSAFGAELEQPLAPGNVFIFGALPGINVQQAASASQTLHTPTSKAHAWQPRPGANIRTLDDVEAVFKGAELSLAGQTCTSNSITHVIAFKASRRVSRGVPGIYANLKPREDNPALPVSIPLHKLLYLLQHKNEKPLQAILFTDAPEMVHGNLKGMHLQFGCKVGVVNAGFGRDKTPGIPSAFNAFTQALVNNEPGASNHNRGFEHLVRCIESSHVNGRQQSVDIFTREDPRKNRRLAQVTKQEALNEPLLA